jgi:hypothetical protein
MRISLVQASLLVMLVSFSFFTSSWSYLPFIFFALLFFLQSSALKLDHKIENLLCIIIALSLKIEVLLVFLVYLPFVVFGRFLDKGGFVKRYIFGFAVSMFSTILLYCAGTYVAMPMGTIIVILFFAIPALMAWMRVQKEERLALLGISPKECIAIIASIGAVFFVAGNILTDSSLFISNGTYQYTKFELIVKGINEGGNFPIYDPAVSQGESPFLFESPLTFSHIAFGNIMLAFIDSVSFYNAYVIFILFISALGLYLLVGAIVGLDEEKNGNMHVFAILIGALSIGLNFYFVQLLESFKAFFTFPMNYLILSIIIGWKSDLKDVLAVIILIPLTFISHTPHGLGIVLIASSMAALHMMRKLRAKEMPLLISLMELNKGKMLAAVAIILLFPLFYVSSSFLFKDALEPRPAMEWDKIAEKGVGYLKGRLHLGEPFSLKYPDTRRNDEKIFGPFLSVVGLISLGVLLVLMKKPMLKNYRMFLFGYSLHFVISASIISSPWVGTLEYSYRTFDPYLLILLASSMVMLITLLGNKIMQAISIAVFAIGLLHSLPVAKENLQNVHAETIIGGESFKNEIEFISALPYDGRIITYGLFANAIDPALASHTDHWFSRFHLTQYARSRSVYATIHESHSFGENIRLPAMSGEEISNHLKLGGYKYVFMDARHPVSGFVIQQLYPNYTYPIYQNNALVILTVNGTAYAETVNVVEELPEEIYKEKGGYGFVKIGDYYQYAHAPTYSQTPIVPRELGFERKSPTKISINGPFEEGEFVVFKETYSPRWKATVKGEEVPTFATSHNLLLIQAQSGTSIELLYEPIAAEKTIGMLSFLGAFGAIVLFILLL